jgi:methyl-accepting chemotaxis protein
MNEKITMKLLTSLKHNSIQTKIAFWAGISLLLSATVIIAYAATSIRSTALDAAQQQAIAVAQTNAAAINEELELAFHTSRMLAQTLAAVKDPENPLDLDREQIDILLHKTLDDNKEFVGVYTRWQPDAFDGMDDEYADTEIYGESGRFELYWARDRHGRLHLEPALITHSPKLHDYYLCPQQTRLECVSDPHPHPEYGEEVQTTSLGVPVIVQGELLGIVGVDIRLDFFQHLADTVELYDGTGRLVLITYNGTLAAATGQPELIGHSAEMVHPDFIRDNELQRVQQGERITEFHENEDLEVYVPIYFLRTWTPWSVSVIVPNEKITADATRLMWQMIAIGVVFVLAGLILLWIISQQIALPIKNVTTVARSVAAGNLDVSASVQSQDETGVLADAFNQMIENLRHMREQDSKAREDLEQQNREQQRLLELVATLETPAITLLEGVLFAPLVGTLDSNRAQRLTTSLLQEVHNRRIRQVILDITGVVTVDTQVAQALLQLVQALRLLGCKVALTGISSEIATTITELGIELKGVATYHSPQEVLVELFTQSLQR